MRRLNLEAISRQMADGHQDIISPEGGRAGYLNINLLGKITTSSLYPCRHRGKCPSV